MVSHTPKSSGSTETGTCTEIGACDTFAEHVGCRELTTELDADTGERKKSLYSRLSGARMKTPRGR